MPITVRLDEMLGRRQMSLTELSEAVDITLANLSILKTERQKRSVSQPWRLSARCSTVSLEISLASQKTETVGPEAKRALLRISTDLKAKEISYDLPSEKDF